MTALLTPEEVHKITRRNHTTFLDCEIVDQSDDEVRLLLRDREAICERHVKLATEYRALESKLAAAREYLNNCLYAKTPPLPSDLFAILENQS